MVSVPNSAPGNPFDTVYILLTFFPRGANALLGLGHLGVTLKQSKDVGCMVLKGFPPGSSLKSYSKLIHPFGFVRKKGAHG